MRERRTVHWTMPDIAAGDVIVSAATGEAMVRVDRIEYGLAPAGGRRRVVIVIAGDAIREEETAE